MQCSASMINACAKAQLVHLTVKKAVESSAEILVSVSRRTISGSFKPALANSCKADGIVAENSSVCIGAQHKLDTAHIFAHTILHIYIYMPSQVAVHGQVLANHAVLRSHQHMTCLAGLYGMMSLTSVQVNAKTEGPQQ